LVWISTAQALRAPLILWRWPPGDPFAGERYAFGLSTRSAMLSWEVTPLRFTVLVWADKAFSINQKSDE